MKNSYIDQEGTKFFGLGMWLSVEHLPSKHQALGSIPSSTKGWGREGKGEGGGGGGSVKFLYPAGLSAMTFHSLQRPPGLGLELPEP
jgi:hypothetical protein